MVRFRLLCGDFCHLWLFCWFLERWLYFSCSRRLPSESIFFKVDSALNTSVVANYRFAMVARQTDDILTWQSLQLYFSRTFWQISFSGCFLAIFVGYLLRGLFRSGYLWQLYYKELSMGVKWPFSMPTKWDRLFLTVLRIWIRSPLPIVYLSWLLDKLTIF